MKIIDKVFMNNLLIKMFVKKQKYLSFDGKIAIFNYVSYYTKNKYVISFFMT